MSPKIFIAADTPDLELAAELASLCHDTEQGLKLGLEFYNAQGPVGVKQIHSAYPDLPIFLDLKFHDIPNTVAGAVRGAGALGVTYANVHASGGRAMMVAAQDAAQGGERIRLLGVTVLTSMDDDALNETGVTSGTMEHVSRLARLSEESGLAGVVCSALEIERLRRDRGDAFVLMVPGIRPEGAGRGDQKRVMTPRDALGAGATHLVIGRPVTQADDPRAALEAILESIS